MDRDAIEAAIRAMVRVEAALGGAGIARWTPSEPPPEGAQLINVTMSVRPGWLWLRPLYTQQSAMVELPLETAVRAIEAFAWQRLRGGIDTACWATEEEALELWDLLVDEAARQVPADDGATVQ